MGEVVPLGLVPANDTEALSVEYSAESHLVRVVSSHHTMYMSASQADELAGALVRAARKARGGLT